MAITYEWSFPNFETDADNKVKVIHWRLTAVDGDYSASMYGSDSETSDQDFATITKEDAKTCVIAHSGSTEAEMETQLASEIASQKAPELTSKTKDW
jgi:hypothetical protein